jgi:hypothetical protein
MTHPPPPPDLLAAGVANGLVAIAAGQVTVASAGGAVNAPQVVTFPAGRFTTPPVVTVSVYAGSNVYVAGIGSPTPSTTQFTATVFRNDGANMGAVNVVVMWIAVQVT